MQARVDEVNAKGEMVALYCTLETLQNATDPVRAATAIAALLRSNAENALPEIFAEKPDSFCVRESSPMYAAESLAVRETLTALCRRAAKPLVVFFDEADCLFGNVLISFLRQLRDGYVNRARIPFPVSIALVGMLDVRDYKAQIRPDGQSLGQISPFNIIAEDILIPNFTESDIAALYSQHTAATGQRFADGVIEAVWRWTRGQPWLVNAIACECVEEIHGNRFGETITVEDVDAAKEAIIRRNPVHLDYLFYMANLPWIKPLVDAGLHGSLTAVQREELNFKVLCGLGLFCDVNGTLEFANPLYAEYWEKMASGELFTNGN